MTSWVAQTLFPSSLVVLCGLIVINPARCASFGILWHLETFPTVSMFCQGFIEMKNNMGSVPSTFYPLVCFDEFWSCLILLGCVASSLNSNWMVAMRTKVCIGSRANKQQGKRANKSSGQIITTSAEVTLNGGLIRELPPNPLNSGLGIILICPESYILGSNGCGTVSDLSTSVPVFPRGQMKV